MAIGRYNLSTGLIFHLDRGVQYAFFEYQEYLWQHQMIQSMSAKGDCYDNACAESFFATLKKELIQVGKLKTRTEAKQAVIHYIKIWYNRRRFTLHLDTCHLTSLRRIITVVEYSCLV